MSNPIDNITLVKIYQLTLRQIDKKLELTN